MAFDNKKLLVFSILLVSLIIFSSGVMAASCPIKVEAKTTKALLAEIPSINTQLTDCKTETPSQLKKLITNGVFLVEITDNDDIYISITDGIITGVSVANEGKYSYRATMSSCNLDVMLKKPNTMAAFASYYLSGKADLGASGIVNKVKLFFGKMFAKGTLKDIASVVEDCAPATDEISGYTGYQVCEFYQAPKVTKKLVTCTAYKAGDSFCVTSMGKDARALKCDDTGVVVCGIKCGQKAPSMCASDINRKRGNNAAPLSFCEEEIKMTDTKTSTKGKKPSNCYETYMQGHEQYQFAKMQWDAWLAETGNICQTQTAEKPKSDGECKYLYEQIKNGDKKWLCWY
ncbi:MAG: hypothetical protein AABW73_01530 [Nanoarchaeota archaeon]